MRRPAPAEPVRRRVTGAGVGVPMLGGETCVVAGRFAPSPTGDLHVGNLRTALAAWLLARHSGRSFLVRMEDLDRVTASLEHECRQLADLERLGLDHDGEVVRQSERFDLYRDALRALEVDDAVYPCWCTRREIAEAASAPHDGPLRSRDEPPARDPDDPGGILRPDGAYPGTCSRLSRAERREREDLGRPPALRLRAEAAVVAFEDRLHGRHRGFVDDLVLRRSDGVPAYHLAVVVDDHLQGVDQVVRGDDLLSSTARHVELQRRLGLRTPEYAHVPLVLGPDGARLAKRHGAVTLTDLVDRGIPPAVVLARLARSLGIDVEERVDEAGALLDRFDLDRLDRRALIWDDPGDG